MEKKSKALVGYLKEMSTDIASEDQIKQVATISANDDQEIGSKIS